MFLHTISPIFSIKENSPLLDTNAHNRVNLTSIKSNKVTLLTQWVMMFKRKTRKISENAKFQHQWLCFRFTILR